MSDQRAGVWFALAAYLFWGFAPIYFKLLDFATPLEIIAHRVVWSVVVLLGLIALRRQYGNLRRLGARRVAWLALSGVLVSVNWGVFVWALLNDRMLETSLGYYINPLVNVVLGGLFLGEWLRPAQKVAVVLAMLGVVNEIVGVGVLPWAGLLLALSFGCYGLVRKRLGVDSAVGLGVETLLMLPLALGYLGWAWLHGGGALARGDTVELGLLAAGGLVTVFPLVCFAAAALRLPLSVLGFFQYLAPSITFLLAVFVYGEPFRLSQTITFGCIWLALVIFSTEGLYHHRRLTRQLGGEVVL
ncbi:MAG: EamA family transporter RarD [Pseudomonadales bacterium]